jgi:hypothetical protein
MNGERTATSMNIEQRLPTARGDQRGAARRLTSGDCGVDADGRPEEKCPRFGSRQFGGVGVPSFPF